jgi:hypothetical protein
MSFVSTFEKNVSSSFEWGRWALSKKNGAKKANGKGSKKTKNNSMTTIGVGDLWIAPKSNLKGDRGDRAWNDRRATPTGSRLLELADIALGLKKPEPPKKRISLSQATVKTENSNRPTSS